MNAQQLEAKSELERNSVENTVGELRRRLSPGQLVDELLAYINDGGGAFISNLGRQATKNPLPVTLIGAGLAWFLFSKSDSNVAAGTTNGMSGSFSDVQTARSSFPDTSAVRAATDAGASVLHSTREGMSAVTEEFSGAMQSSKAALSSASHTVTDGIARGAESVRETAQSASRTAGALANSAAGFFKDQPLVILGAGLALGAAIGAGLPSTETENNLMGKASDQVKKEAKDVASDQLDKAKLAGDHLYQEIKQEVREGVSGLTGTHVGQPN